MESVSNLMIMLETFCIKGEKMSTKQSKLFQIKEAILRLFIRVFQFQENLLVISTNQSFQSKSYLSKISTKNQCNIGKFSREYPQRVERFVF